MKNLENKIVVITGAGSGIGRALAMQFAKEKCKLALNDFNEQELDNTINMLPNTMVYKGCFDVSKKDDFDKFAKNVIDHFGKVDVVINNAGVALGRQTALQTSIEEYEWIMGVNLWGVIHGTRAFLPSLLLQKEASLINISSVFGLMGIADQTPYCTTKFAVRGFTESLRMEMINTSVTVMAVHPGGIKTNIARNSKGWSHVKNKEALIAHTEKESFKHTPEKAAGIIIKGLKKKKQRILIGPEAYVMDYLSRLAPVRYTRFVFNQIKKKMLQ